MKQFFTFLVFVVIVTIALMFIAPSKQKVEREIVIDKPIEQVYTYLSRLENFNKWSVWNQTDSTLVNNITGTDGTAGAENNWSGHPELSGQGSIKIISLQKNEEINHHLVFKKPKTLEADSDFSLENLNGQTKIKWVFTMNTPRPWNIFNLFSSLDKKMGGDFEQSLQNLKNLLEKKSLTAPAVVYKVEQLNFPATTFAAYRQQVDMNAIPSFYPTQLPLIHTAVTNASATPGLPSGLFYEWDEKGQRADMAAAIVVPAGIKLNDNVQLITIEGSKAVAVDYYGAYHKSQNAYLAIDKYLADNKLKQKSPVIEQYLNDPVEVKDTAKWHTKIIFLVE